MRHVISTPNAPRAIGPYSQAIKAGEFIFISGQISIDPESGNVMGGAVTEQTERVMKNLAAILEAAGSSMEMVVKSTVYLKSMADFPAMNEVYATFFDSAPPARATVEVSRLPKDVLVEIDVVALA